MRRKALHHSSGRVFTSLSPPPLLLLPLLLLLVDGGEQLETVTGVVHTEGGSFQPANDQQMYSRFAQELLPPASIGDELAQWGRAPSEERVPTTASDAEEIDYEAIPIELPLPRGQLDAGFFGPQQQVSVEGPKLEKFAVKLAEMSRRLGQPVYDAAVATAIDSENGKKLRAAFEAQGERNVAVSSDGHEELKPLSTPQKKGQSEFVEFVEPVQASSKLKHKEVLEKRVADRGVWKHQQAGLSMISASGNVLFIAFVTMGCVLMVIGMAGGAYYYKSVRSARDDPFDDFTRYSPAGPGKQKRNKVSSSSSFMTEKGDESLAYRAQLHQYQQSKQKIIGGSVEGGGASVGFNGCGGVDDDTSDKSNDDGVDLEHNFSVYEYPGLAPTGDIEVNNPNFVECSSERKQSRN